MTLDETAPPNAPEAKTDEQPTAAPGPVDRDALRRQVIDILHTIYDPEIPVDIFEMGLIYDVAVDEEGRVEIRMTLTTPACPVAGSLPGEVEARVAGIPGVREVRVDLVWDPPWNPSMMSEAARLELGF